MNIGEGNDNPLSILTGGNTMDRGAGGLKIHGVRQLERNKGLNNISILSVSNVMHGSSGEQDLTKVFLCIQTG